jgi:hypothetical protein
MRSLLIRCYPARWRDRYGDEFGAILEERPLGPFDVADVLLGALDARLRQGRLGADSTQGRRFSMSLRIGGIAAMVGAPTFVAGFVAASGTFGDVATRTAALLLLAGSIGLLIALVGLSAFQARVHPLLSWFAFALPAVGTIGLILGAASTALGWDELTEAFYLGLLTFFLGSLLFAIVTFLTAVLWRWAAVLLGAATLLALTGGGGEESRPILIIASLTCFTVGWVALGIQAVRLDRPLTEPNPA